MQTNYQLKNAINLPPQSSFNNLLARGTAGRLLKEVWERRRLYKSKEAGNRLIQKSVCNFRLQPCVASDLLFTDCSREQQIEVRFLLVKFEEGEVLHCHFFAIGKSRFLLHASFLATVLDYFLYTWIRYFFDVFLSHRTFYFLPKFRSNMPCLVPKM